MITYILSRFFLLLSFLFGAKINKYKKYLYFKAKHLVPIPVSKTPSESSTETTEILMPNQVDSRGSALAGVILSKVDIVAGITARKHAGVAAVTASLEAVHFLQPAKAGDILYFKTRVNRAYNTSMELGVRVEAENVTAGQKWFCCHAYLTFVAIEEGIPVKVPKLSPQTSIEKARYRNADERRSLRQKQQALLPSLRSLKGLTKPNQLTKSQSMDYMQSSPSSAMVSPSSASESMPPSKRITGLFSKSYVEMTNLIMPQDANTLNRTFGGRIIALMELAALASASKHSRSHLLTASIDSLSFLKPTFVGDVVLIKACVSRSFHSSLEVYVTVEAGNGSEPVRFTNDAYFSLVAVDDKGEKSVSVPELEMDGSEEDQQRYDGAIYRRECRLREREDLKRRIGRSNDLAGEAM